MRMTRVLTAFASAFVSVGELTAPSPHSVPGNHYGLGRRIGGVSMNLNAKHRATKASMSAAIGAISVAALLMPPTPAAQAARGADVTKGVATFSGAPCCSFTFDVDVTSTNGADVKGKFSMEQVTPDLSFTRTGKATCHEVSGRTASITALWKKPVTLPDGTVVTGVVLWVEDDAVINPPDPDDMTWSFLRQSETPTCFPPFALEQDITSGDVLVIDG